MNIPQTTDIGSTLFWVLYFSIIVLLAGWVAMKIMPDKPMEFEDIRVGVVFEHQGQLAYIECRAVCGRTEGKVQYQRFFKVSDGDTTHIHFSNPLMVKELGQ